MLTPLSTTEAGPGDLVEVSSEPSAESIAAITTAAQAGATIVPLPPDRRATAKASVASYRPQPGDRCVVFTSGSTGEPKGVVLTNRNIEANAVAVVAALRLTADDRWLLCMPLHHIGGLSIVYRAMHTGFAVVPVGPFEPHAVIRAIEEHGITAISLVPTMLHRLLEAGWEGANTLRFALVGGAPCPQRLLDEAMSRGIPVAPTYGMTETASQAATLPPWEVAPRGTVGKALTGFDIRTGDSPAEPATPGTPGRIWIRGEAVARETIDGPLALEDGWLATDDEGSLDADGSLTVLGRVDGTIITGGENVSPGQVEEALLRIPAVAQTAVVGISDAEYGERVVAAVVLKEPADSKALRHEVARALPRHAIPREIVVLDSLPQSAPGETDRRRLREMLGGT